VSGETGYFIPYRYAAATMPCGYPAIAPIFDAAGDNFHRMLECIDSHAADFARFGGEPPAPRFEQDWFPRLDACAAYAMIRQRRPGLIVEVGCGHSTRIMARATEDSGAATRHICIDPAPRARLQGLAVEHVPATVDRLDHGQLDTIAAADLLFIDSSHIAVAGSDVDRLVNGILPRLRPGAAIHFHDIFLPEAYPEAWAWRGYNEQSLVAALLSGGGYTVEFASAFVIRRMARALASTCVANLPLMAGAVESSLWLRKRQPR
jgi:hypothetical protein